MRPRRPEHAAAWLLLVATSLLGACVHRASDRGPRERLAVPPAPPRAYYEAPGPIPRAISRTRAERGPGWVRETVLVPPRVPPALAAVPLAEDPIELDHFRPHPAGPGPRPLVLLSPILGNTELLVDVFAADFAREGWHAVIVQRKELEFDPAASLDRAEAELRLLVMRGRQALDFLLATESIDRSRIATFGISAGAVVSTMLAGADGRFAAHVWMLGGGPLADVMADTEEERFREYGRRTLEATGLDPETLRRRLRDETRTDPVRLAARIPRAGVLLVLARHDRSVPTRYGLLLWHALGRPRLVVTPFGHYTTFALLPFLRTLARGHLRQTFRASGR